MIRRDSKNPHLERAEALEKEIRRASDSAVGSRAIFQLGTALASIGGALAILACTVLLSPAPLLVDQDTAHLRETQTAVEGLTEIAQLLGNFAIGLLALSVVTLITGRWLSGRHESRIAEIQLEHSRELTAAALPPNSPKPRPRGLLRRSK